MLRKIVSAAVLSLAAMASLFAQQPVDGKEIYLRNVEWKVEGRSRLFALRNASEIEGDERFASSAEFEAWIADTTQKLMNQRVLDSVSIQATYGGIDAAGAVPADIVVKVKDTWNVIALPKPQYDSNDGFELILKARDYNFLGTMQPLRLDFGYIIDPEPFKAKEFDKGSIVAEIDTEMPFTAFGYDWKFDFDHLFSYTYKEPLEYENKTGITYTLPVRIGKVNFGLYQGFYLNDENGDEYQEAYGDRLEGWHWSNWFETSWEIPTGIDVYRFGELNYIPRGIIKNNYLPNGEYIGPERKGPTIELGHELEFGRVDWIGNYRKGVTGSVDNENVYNLHSVSWDKSVSASLAGYAPLASCFGVSSRLSAAVYLDDPNTSAGDSLRGILDDEVDADAYLYFNLDIPVRVIRFMPYEWFGKRWMKIFEFEQHWSPILDMGLVRYQENDIDFSIDDMLITGGLEVITFPKAFRSFYVRISAGFDLRTAIEDRQRPSFGDLELFLGLNHMY